MLEGLDRVDWGNIAHSHGKAHEFPKWIRELASDNKSTRQDAFRNIAEYSFHQGTLYDVTPYVVPFLIELLQAEGVDEKGWILALLGNFADEAHPRYGGECIIPPGPDADARHHSFYNHYLELMEVTYQAVLEGSTAYSRLLQHGDPHIRTTSFYVLTHLVHRDPHLCGVLCNALEREKQIDAQCRMLDRLGRYIATDDTLPANELSKVAQTLRTLFQSTSNNRLLYSFAKPLVLIEPSELETDYAAVFKNVIVNPTVYSREKGISLSTGVVVAEACSMMVHLPKPIAIQSFMEILPDIQFPDDAHDVAIRLLDLVLLGRARGVYRKMLGQYLTEDIFFERLPRSYPVSRPDNSGVPIRLDPEGRLYPAAEKPMQISKLDALQRQAIELVLKCDTIWLLHSNLLEIYGLPALREEAQRLYQAESQ